MSTAPTEGLVPTPISRYAERGSVRRVVDVVFKRAEITIAIVLVVLVVYFSIRNSTFYSYANVVTMLQYIAPIAVIGAGEVLLLDLAEIDLSAGQVFLTAPWLVVLLHQHGVPLGLGIALAILICAAIGAFNGGVIVWLRVPSFVATLGTNYVLAGFVLIASSQIQTSMVGTTGKFGSWFGISNWSETICAFIIALIIWAMLKGTAFGLHITATGGNELGAEEAGIRVRRVKVLCFVILSIVAGIIGIFDA